MNRNDEGYLRRADLDEDACDFRSDQHIQMTDYTNRIVVWCWVQWDFVS
jgi:hypothetical protein